MSLNRICSLYDLKRFTTSKFWICFFRWMFYGFYRGKSPFHSPPFGRNMFGTCSIRIKKQVTPRRSRWWQLKFFYVHPENLGKINPTWLERIFFRNGLAKNHQPETIEHVSPPVHREFVGTPRWRGISKIAARAAYLVTRLMLARICRNKKSGLGVLWASEPMVTNPGSPKTGTCLNGFFCKV